MSSNFAEHSSQELSTIRQILRGVDERPYARVAIAAAGRARARRRRPPVELRRRGHVVGAAAAAAEPKRGTLLA